MIETQNIEKIDKTSLETALSVTTKVNDNKDDQINFKDVFFTLLSSTFGASSMGLCAIAAKSGIVLYIFLLLIAISVNYASYYCFIYLSEKLKLKNFHEFSVQMLGKKFSWISDFLLMICNLGNLIGNILITNIYICNLFKNYQFQNEYLTEPQYFTWVIVIMIITFPFTIKKQLKDLKIINVLTIFIIFFFINFSIYNFFYFDPVLKNDSIAIELFRFQSLPEISDNYFYIFFCFVCQQNLIIIFNENKLSHEQAKKILNYHFIFIGMIFLTFGILGYITFYFNSLVETSTYLSLFTTESSFVVTAQILMITLCLISYIFQFKPTRDIINIYADKLVDIDQKNQLNIQGIFQKYKFWLLTFGMQFFIAYSGYQMTANKISFMELLDFLSIIIVPWCFVIWPVKLYINQTKKKVFWVFIFITLTFLFMNSKRVLKKFYQLKQQ